MKLVAPIHAPNEVDALVDAGADELYCGLLEPWWQERYGTHDSINRRQKGASLASREELARLVARADARGAPVYLTVNMRYTEPQLGYLVELCADFEQMGGTGLQIADIGLLSRLKDAQLSLRLCLSLLAVADNIPTIELYRKRLGVDRVVLPRFVTEQEAAALLAPFAGLEAEGMAFFDKCPFVDGYCRAYHGVAYRERHDGEAPAEGLEPLTSFDTTFTTHACLKGEQRYLQSHPCAACYLARYEDAGVGFAKIGGRGRPLEDRLAALCFLRAALQLRSDAERVQLYEQSFNQPCQCYCGTARQQRTAIPPTQSRLPEDCRWLAFGASPGRARRVYVGSETERHTLEQLLAARDWLAAL
ncbi:MAG: U32 family peptidase, partial [Coriobacteriales bacterium]|nr:U32 family peptidase [Coriobacteriales bacterium]